MGPQCGTEDVIRIKNLFISVLFHYAFTINKVRHACFLIFTFPAGIPDAAEPVSSFISELLFCKVNKMSRMPTSGCAGSLHLSLTFVPPFLLSSLPILLACKIHICLFYFFNRFK